MRIYFYIKTLINFDKLHSRLSRKIKFFKLPATPELIFAINKLLDIVTLDLS